MTFFLDLWQDLRDKRLWPVAVALAAAALAIPLVMLKPAAEPTAPPVVAAHTAPPGTLPAVSVDTKPIHGSKLETFSQRNPFKPLGDLKKQGANDPGAGSGSGSGSSGSGGSSGGGSPSSGGGLSSLGGSGGSGGGSSPGTSVTPPSSGTPDVAPGTHWFRFTVDLSFGSLENEKKLKGVTTGTRLPSSDDPQILYMGLAEGAKKALFFVADPTLKAEGEGTCSSKENCTFVTLGVGQEEQFTTSDGSVGYTLKLLALHRETVSKTDVTGDTTPTKGSPKRIGGAGGKTIADANQDFLPRLISGAVTGEPAR